MAACAYCGSGIIFGGTREGALRYCNARCASRGNLLALSHQLPDSLIQEHLLKVHQGRCPKCGGPGPVDVYMFYRVWSALVITSWNNFQQICCRGCAVKSQLGSTLYCLLLGWWGFPFGLVMTPVQIVRNLGAAVRSPDPSRPSEKLERLVRVNVAGQLAASRPAQPPTLPR